MAQGSRKYFLRLKDLIAPENIMGKEVEGQSILAYNVIIDN